jgi:ribosomal protein S18 acetylase RimI-like enzyme
MIKFKNLSQVTNEELVSCFNLAFSDYVLPAKLTVQQLEKKIYTEDINKDISVGAFKNDQLVAFVMHAERKKEDIHLAYNGGTGVIPSARGQSLTIRMYDYILPIIKSRGFNEIALEVIHGNVAAIKSYEKIGFILFRNLNCYKGDLNITKINPDIQVIIDSSRSRAVLSQFGEIEATWQNANRTILNLKDDACYLLANIGQELCGYCIINRTNNRIMQIAVKKNLRNQLIGSTLLYFIEHNISKSTSIINVDSAFEKTNAFLKNRNMEQTIQQHEMKLVL